MYLLSVSLESSSGVGSASNKSDFLILAKYLSACNFLQVYFRKILPLTDETLTASE